MSGSSISISKLRTDVGGRVIGPEDAEYDEARTVFYGGIDRRPAAIVRVKDDMDVSRVVSLARESGVELAVRSGGHSIPGHGVSEGGIVIDLSDLRAFDIDVEGRTVWAQTGLTAGEFSAAANAYGLGVGFGDTGSVGIGGITLGGGIGYLARKHGLTIDDLLAADLVTADGEIVRVDAETEPDLFSSSLHAADGDHEAALDLRRRSATIVEGIAAGLDHDLRGRFLSQDDVRAILEP